jgi:AraC family transcriptional regulator, transcriptional activator of pobA
MQDHDPGIAQSVAGMRHSSAPRAPVTRLAGRTAHGVPVAVFRRVPGAPPMAVEHLSEQPLTADPLPTGRTHTHDFLVLFYAQRASGTIGIDERSWPVTNGDLFVIAPGQVLSFTGPIAEFVEDSWVVFFPADVIRGGAYSSWRAHPLLYTFAQGIDRPQRLRIPPAEQPSWVERIATLDAELRARRDGYQEAALAHLTLLLVAVSRLAIDVTGELRSAAEPLLAAVFDLIEKRYHEPISLADIATELSLTAGHLTTVVRRKTGRTVQRWLTERRMQQARLLLTDTNLTVAAISRRVGYPDVSYFIKRFRADHEVTPAQWRHAAGLVMPG